MKIAIVILNWNGEGLLKQFLPSVVSHSIGADIYVADNASMDDSILFVQSSFPAVRIIENKENGGYAKGYNDALKNIDADVFCLLNNDVEVTKNWLDPIIAEFENGPNTVVLQPKILDHKQKDVFEYAGAAGGFIDKYGYPYCRGRIFNTLEKDRGQYDGTSSIFWASGACFFIRRDVFQEVKGFDATFFAHMEEIDLCWRVRNLGYDIKYVFDSKVFHVGGATLDDSNPKKTFLNFRNSLFTLSKNSSGVLLPKILIRLILDGIAGVKFLMEFKALHTWAIIRAHFSFYLGLSRALEKRDQPRKLANYWHKKSIVWSYYVDRKKHFDSL